MNGRLSVMCGLCLCLSACGGLFQVDIEYPTAAAAINRLTQITTTDPPGATAPTKERDTPTPPPAATLAQSPTLLPTPEPGQPTYTATPCGPPPGWARYIVRPGDTLFDLGIQTHISVQQLQIANCLTATTIRAGQELFVPFVPTPTFTPTPTPVPTLTPDPAGILSPDGKRYVTQSGIVVDLERGFVSAVTADSSPWQRFWRWTADSRYAIFTRINQYGNGQTIVFDAQPWQTIITTSGCGAPSAPCLEYPKALHPSAPRFLMADGRLVTLPAFQPIDLLAAWRSGSQVVTEAAWSPNGGYLAFVAGPSELTSFALYFAQGDGSQVRQAVASLEGGFRTLGWAPDGQTVTVVTSTYHYVLYVAAGQVVVTTPTPAASLTPPPAAIPSMGSR